MANPNRTADGKFARNEHQAKLRDAFASAISSEDIERLARVLMRFAEAGDMVALKMLLERACGKPEGPERVAGPSVAIQFNGGNDPLVRIAERIQAKRLGGSESED